MSRPGCREDCGLPGGRRVAGEGSPRFRFRVGCLPGVRFRRVPEALLSRRRGPKRRLWVEYHPGAFIQGGAKDVKAGLDGSRRGVLAKGRGIFVSSRHQRLARDLGRNRRGLWLLLLPPGAVASLGRAIDTGRSAALRSVLGEAVSRCTERPRCERRPGVSSASPSTGHASPAAPNALPRPGQRVLARQFGIG